MKNKLFALMILPLLTILVAAAPAGSVGNCYERYAKKFEERGATEVENGWHEGVVITFRKGSNADCYVGMVRVEELKITQLKIRNADGTYELYTQKFKAGGDFVVTNGISTTQITMDDELVNVVFVKHIKAPKKKFTAAPDPDDL
ncbi:MAG: hypothetical protein ACJAZ2_000263 [Glaciecola sp.]|jgi:hypothetical protein